MRSSRDGKGGPFWVVIPITGPLWSIWWAVKRPVNDQRPFFLFSFGPFYSVSFHLVYLCLALDTSRQTLLGLCRCPIGISPFSLSLLIIFMYQLFPLLLLPDSYLYTTARLFCVCTTRKTKDSRVPCQHPLTSWPRLDYIRHQLSRIYLR